VSRCIRSQQTIIRSFLRAVGGLGSLALPPWSRSLGAESRLTDLLILLPGITGSVLQKNKKERRRWRADQLARNLQGLEVKDRPQAKPEDAEAFERAVFYVSGVHDLKAVNCDSTERIA
jgi:hypothetical protein